MSSLTPNKKANKSILQRLLSGGAWVLSGRLIAAVAGMGINILLARLMTPTEVGFYFMVVSITVLGGVVAQFGMHRTIVRVIASGLATESYSELNKNLKGILCILLITTAVVCSAYMAGVGMVLSKHVFNAPILSSVLLITAIWIALRTAQTMLSQAFRGFHNLRDAALYNGAASNTLIFLAIAACVLLGYELSFERALLLSVLAFFIVGLLGIVLLTAHLRPLPKSAGANVKTVADISLPLFISSVAVMGATELHLWVLSAASSAEDVALYGTSFRLIQVVAMPLVLVNNVIPPMIADFHARGEKGKIQDVLQGTATVIAIPLLLMVAIFIPFAEELLATLFGDYYAAAANITLVLLVAQSVNGLAGSPGVLMAMSNKQSLLMKINLSGGLLGLLTSVYLVQPLGALGVAIGYGVGLTAQNILLYMFARFKLGVKTNPSAEQLKRGLRRARGEIARRVHGSIISRVLERIIRPLENIYYPLVGRQIVECLGDDQTNVFSKVDLARRVQGFYFRPTTVQGATAYGVANPSSKTGAFTTYTYWLKRRPSNCLVLFLLGEVDLGYNLWLMAERKQLPVDELVDLTVKKYTLYLAEHIVPSNLVLMSAPLPAVGDGETGIKGHKLRPGLDASQWQRTQLTLRFNAGLRAWCKANQVYFLDLESRMIDLDSGVLCAAMMKPGKIDNHLAAEPFAEAICEFLQEHTLQEWFSNGDWHG